MSYKENLQENKKRVEYAWELWWVYNLASFSVALFLVHLFFDEDGETSLINYFLNVPHGRYTTFYLFFGMLLLVARWWWKGLPSLVFKLPFVKKNSPQWLIDGREKTLEHFFYQGVTMSDELPRSKVIEYLSDGKYDVSNFFDYDPLNMQKNKNGTARIISYFRDHTREKIVKNTKSSNTEKKERAKIALVNYDNKYMNTKKPSSSQEELYYDLFASIDGMMLSYKDDFNRVEKGDFPSPLSLSYNKKTKEILSYTVDESIDVFRKGKVYFSIRMVTETTRNMTALFATFLKTQINRKSRICTKYGDELTTGNIETLLDFFKIVFFRRLLLNYGALPSGWFVGRIECYDLRAIISAVDREMIPTITSNNDGSNNDFSSDVFASMFLYVYWSFLKSPSISETLDGIDWCFNTVKTLTEVQVRNFSTLNKDGVEELITKKVNEEDGDEKDSKAEGDR